MPLATWLHACALLGYEPQGFEPGGPYAGLAKVELAGDGGMVEGGVPDGPHSGPFSRETDGDAPAALSHNGPKPPDDGGADDAGSPMDQCVEAPDGRPCDDGLFCTSGEMCRAGVCGGGESTDCSGLDALCGTGVCRDDIDTCVVDSESLNGWTCGTDRVCLLGECLPGAQCPPNANCNFDCAEASSCVAGCANADVCTVACSAGTNCLVDCRRANDCTGSCDQQASCQIGCVGAKNCGISCTSMSSCDYDCTDANNCDQVDCLEEAACVINCSGADKCGFRSCWTTPVVCPDGQHIHCGAKCP